MKNTINIELNSEVIASIGDQLKAYMMNEIEKRSFELQQAGYLNVKESAKYCGMSVPTLKDAVAETGTEAYKKGGKILYKRDDLDKMMNFYYGV